jgi:hypothetical protein
MKSLFTFLTLSLLVSACLYEKGTAPDPTGSGGTDACQQSSGNNGGVAPQPGEVCFDKDIMPIFNNNCAMSTCHDALTASDGYNLANYGSIIRKGITPGRGTSGKIYEVITSTRDKDRMPPPARTPLTKTQVDLLVAWVNQGAKNTVCNPVSTTNVTYSGSIKPLLEANCLGCHGRGLVSGGVSLDSYAAVKVFVGNKKLYGSISQQAGYRPMPQGGRLGVCEIAMVKKWIDAGAPNN